MCNRCNMYNDDGYDPDHDREHSAIFVVILIVLISSLYGVVKILQHDSDRNADIADRMAKRELCMTEHLVEKDYSYHKANQICSTQNGLNPENFNQYHGKNHDN